MLAKTHIVLGICAGVAALAPAGPAQVAIVAAAAAAGALLPDIDHPNALLRQRLGAPGHLAFFWIKHRSWTHSAAAIAGVVLIGLYLDRVLGLAFAAGYGSHVLADMLTASGVPMLWPISGIRWRVPLIRTGGKREFLLFVLVALGLCLWVVQMLIPYF